MARRYYKSTAVATTLSSPILSGSTAWTVGVVTGWPTNYPFTAVIDPDTSDEEVVTVTAGPGTAWTVTRGEDGTSAVAHDAGAVIRHGVSARDFDEPNAHIAASAAVHGLSGTVVGTTDTQSLTNKTLDAGSTLGGVSGTLLAGDRTAWTSYTPTFSNCTNPTGNFYYKLIGKTLYVRGYFTGGTFTANGTVEVSLPGSYAARTGTGWQHLAGGGWSAEAPTVWFIQAGASVVESGGNGGAGLIGGALAYAGFTGVIEVN